MTDPGTSPTIPAVLDHVAVAAESWHQVWPRYIGQLGGSWSSGELGPGFAPCQLRYANRAVLEILAPNRTDVNPFLRRFIDRNGTGPHHVTFKVPDLDAAIDAARAAGIDPVNIDRSDPSWQEAFLHPSRALGIVVQLAQQQGEWQIPPPDDYTGPDGPAATLLRATHAVADLAAGQALFAGLLGGTVIRQTRSADGTTDIVDLAWSGPLGLRLVGPAPGSAERAPALRSWLGDRSGRLHHVAFACPDPARLPDAVPVPEPLDRGPAAGGLVAEDLVGLALDDDAIAIVPPGANLGTRLVLCRANP